MTAPVDFQDRSGFKAEMNKLLEMDPASTVLVTVDMQRDYLDLDIATAPLSKDEVDRIMPATERLLRQARAAGIPVVHAYVRRRPAEHAGGFAGNMYSRVGQAARVSQNVNASARTRPDRLEDSIEADLPDSLLAPSDIHMVTKKTMDSFYGSDLEVLLLRALRPTTLIIVGINTDTCVYSTAFSAANRGYQVVLSSDCTASMRGKDQHWMALELMSRSIGWVLTNDEIASRLGLPEDVPTVELADATVGGR
jgi:nicotinamidase-related amidase